MKTTKKAQDTSTTPSARGLRSGRVRLRIVILLILLGAAATLMAPKALYLMHHETTDDAFLAGTIVPVSAEVKGRVVQVHIKENRMVAAGDLLCTLDQRDYQLALESKQKALATRRAEQSRVEAAIAEARKKVAASKAALAEAEIREEFAARDMKRNESLLNRAVVSKREYDYARTQWQLAKAGRNAAESAVAGAEATVATLKAENVTEVSRIAEAAQEVRQAELDLSRTEVRSPIAGRVTQKSVEAGKYVQAGQPLLAIVDTNDVWIAANYKENQIGKIRPGQRADIKIDAYPDLVLHGHVDSLQPGTGSVFSLLPPENATGNFVKIVQRLPVKIIIDSRPDPKHPLFPGLSVAPSIDTRKLDTMSDHRPQVAHES